MQALMQKAKASLKPAIHGIAYGVGLSTRLSLASGRSFILMYHGVSDEADRSGSFEKQLAYLNRHFDIVSVEHLLSRIKNGSRQGKIPVAITFDDGLKNNFTHVAPVLRKHHIPATFFVCPALVDSGAWLWNIEARLRLMSLPAAGLQTFLTRNEIPGSTAEAAIDWMKEQPIAVRQVIEQRIRAATPSFVPSQEQHQRYDLMNWSEIAALPELITIGSHTNHHPILTTLNQEELLEEITGSKNALENRLQRPCHLFCYPNGSNDASVVHAVSQHYKAALCVDEGYVSPADDPYQLKRIAVQPETGMPQFTWQLHRADY